MTDQEQRPDFGGQFVPQPPSQTDKPEAQPAPRRQRGGRRPTRKPRTKPQAAAPGTPAPKPAASVRRGPKPVAARATRIDLSLAVTAFAGLSEEAANALASISRIIDALPKRMRFPVVRALGKLFP